MSVEVRLPTILRPLANGQASVRADGATVGEVFGDLVRQFPGLEGRVITADGTLHKFVNVYLNDEDVRLGSGLKAQVSDKDEISIVPAVAGGSRRK